MLFNRMSQGMRFAIAPIQRIGTHRVGTPSVPQDADAGEKEGRRLVRKAEKHALNF